MYYLRNLFQIPLKYRSFSSISYTLECLKERTLIKVTGNEVADYLQGLITNDIKHLEDGTSSMFTMFLNTRGRVLYDTIIYKLSDYQTYFIECDKGCSESLQKHLKLFRVRRKIDVVNVENEYQLYVLFNKNFLFPTNDFKIPLKTDDLKEQFDKMSSEVSTKFFKDLFIFKDPRILSLGSRIIAAKSVDVKKQINEIVNLGTFDDIKNYRWLRYSLGIGEGINDLPPTICFPLECNCDYLHGVSFHKGCYIGQELTARIHHTGVVRKRLLSVKFKCPPSNLPDDGNISNGGKTIGTLRGVVNDVGLALLRFNEAFSLKELQIGDTTAIIEKPNWWPIEAPKDKINKYYGK